jgi:hypothetical protein
MTKIEESGAEQAVQWLLNECVEAIHYDKFGLEGENKEEFLDHFIRSGINFASIKVDDPQIQGILIEKDSPLVSDKDYDIYLAPGELVICMASDDTGSVVGVVDKETAFAAYCPVYLGDTRLTFEFVEAAYKNSVEGLDISSKLPIYTISYSKTPDFSDAKIKLSKNRVVGLIQGIHLNVIAKSTGNVIEARDDV